MVAKPTGQRRVPTVGPDELWSAQSSAPQVVAYAAAADPWQIWRLIPAKVEGIFTPLQLPSGTPGLGSPANLSDGDAAGQSSTRDQHTESERDGFGTIVTEVTTVTTRKRYRVADA